mmetsp:Transcript_112399/g.324702  ORF Transcript_112399/g.324702 Transcript_112399/m.324702 type:complete len:280 (-) Transcript_112399:304-1143(-)
MWQQCASFPRCWVPLLLGQLVVGQVTVQLPRDTAPASQAPIVSRYSDKTEGASVEVPPITELNKITFDGNVLSGAPHVVHWIVAFCPTWWEPCQKIEGPFTALGIDWQGKLNHDMISLHVRFAKVDCATEKVLCNEQGVDTYPVVAHYSAGAQVALWRGGTKKDHERLTKWISGRLGASSAAAERASEQLGAFAAIARYLPPGERSFDVLLVILSLAATLRLVLSNAGLWEKTPTPAADAPAADSPAAVAMPSSEAAAPEPRHRSLPETWPDRRTSLEL